MQKTYENKNTSTPQYWQKPESIWKFSFLLEAMIVGGVHLSGISLVFLMLVIVEQDFILFVCL